MTRSTKRATVAEQLRLGVFFYRRGSLDLAIEQFLAASKRSPHAPNIWLNLGAAYIDKNDLGNAKAALEHALTLKPDYASAFFHLGQLYDKQADAENAFSCFNQVITLEPHGELARRAREQLEGFRFGSAFRLHQELSK
jgi:tetratricopeptide (TPR) repeat protein